MNNKGKEVSIGKGSQSRGWYRITPSWAALVEITHVASQRTEGSSDVNWTDMPIQKLSN